MSDDALTSDPSSPEEDLASSEAVEELLRQLVDARFVLTDRDGAVTRWSGPAEELFGWPAAWMLGRPLVKTLWASRTRCLPVVGNWRRWSAARTATSSRWRWHSYRCA